LLSINELAKRLSFKEFKIIQTVRFMLDNGQIVETETMRLKIKEL